MNTLAENQELETVSLSDLDEMELHEADAVLEKIESNTQWKDPEKNMMRNGAKMFGC